MRKTMRKADSDSPIYSGIRVLFAVAPAGTYPKVRTYSGKCVKQCVKLRPCFLFETNALY
jgi:hypothetical protein